MTTLSDASALGDARNWLRERVDDGEHCPLCGQFAKVYRRKITSGMACALIVMFQEDPMCDWLYLPNVLLNRTARDESGLRYWGLIEEASERRPDGGRAGWWRITEKGNAYVQNSLTVEKYALIYDGRCLGFDGPQVDIRDALGTKFDYSELMAGV